MSIHPVLSQLFVAFESAGITWCLLRGDAFLVRPEGDVDLLVAGYDLQTAEEVIFSLSGVAFPKNLHPWHRFYAVRDHDTRRWIKLDIVTRLIYSRRLSLASALEEGCLARRRQRGEVFVLDPTDAFWTLILHGILDKSTFSARRATEICKVVDKVSRPSPGEDFYASICPPSWEATSLLSAARSQDWTTLAGVGAKIASLQGADSPAWAAAVPRPWRSRLAEGVRPLLLRASRIAYRPLWRLAGLGAPARVLNLVDVSLVHVLVLRIGRKVGVREVVLLVPKDVPVLEARLRRDGYRFTFGSWLRLTASGLERVDVVPASRWCVSPNVTAHIFVDCRPIPGRTHSFRPSPSMALVLTALSAMRPSALFPPSDHRFAVDVSAAPLLEARAFAVKHGLREATAALSSEELTT